ncbi:MAG: glycyl-radical enzyme activating protein [Clostridia bacterium]|nr:glycyl-radical enzyme activating protein [Clostridia bacterium]
MNEKALVFGIKRFAVHDGPGIRTTLFLKGCPLKCVWCHNPEGIRKAPQTAYFEERCISCGACAGTGCRANAFENGTHVFIRDLCSFCGKCAEICPAGAFVFYGKSMDTGEAFAALAEDAAFYSDGGGITLSGGECLTYPDFCVSLLRKCAENGIGTAVDTCGAVPAETFERVMPYTGLFLYDIKAFDRTVHKKCTGADNALILGNLRFLAERGAAVEIRIPLVPGYNDGEIPGIAAFLAGLPVKYPVRILPYHRQLDLKYGSLGLPRDYPDRVPLPNEIKKAEDTLASFGLRVIK